MQGPVGGLHRAPEVGGEGLLGAEGEGGPAVEHLAVDLDRGHFAGELAGGRATHSIGHQEEQAALPQVEDLRV
ncbi:hypothetical protein D3C83_270590 [compost metagenome]